MKPGNRTTRPPRAIRWRFERPDVAPYTPGLSPVADMWARFARATSGHLITGSTLPATEPQTVQVQWRPRLTANK